MTGRSRWERCIHHRGDDAEQFVDDYFGRPDRQVLVIGGCGFDPRSLFVPERLADRCNGRVSGLFLREERPEPDAVLRDRADANQEKIQAAIPSADITPVDVFDIDNAPVGGRRAVAAVDDRIDLAPVTDVVLDASALSSSVMFPLAKYCFETAQQRGRRTNFHLVVLDDPRTDVSIEATACGKASPFHSFKGERGLDARTDAARLWLPQLGHGRREFLNLIFDDVDPHAVCPIVPFPAVDPRTGDSLIEEYEDLFESVGGAMTRSWDIDARDIIYAHEKSPLDLYRSVLRIDDARRRVFAESGGSQLFLSPLGSKAVGVGLLMAALERDFAVVSVETIEYRLRESTPDGSIAEKVDVEVQPELVHVWLHGEAYPSPDDMEASANGD